MIFIERIEDLKPDHPSVVVALGTFDGVHLGHQEILRRVVRRARQAGGTATVFTFARHPLEVVHPAKAPPLITPLPIKRDIMQTLGVDLLVAVTFTPFLAGTPPRDFVKTYLVDRLRARCVCVGYDFAFGQARAGSPETLRTLGEEHHFDLEVVPPMALDDQVISSTLIRRLLATGELLQAARYLGRPYAIRGTVEPGTGRGKGLGYPTANLPATSDLLIPDGVYAGQLWFRQTLQRALINVGTAPTFGGGIRRVEAHLVEGGGELYGQTVTLFFLGRLRDERRFESPNLLRQQIELDRRDAETLFTVFPRYSAEEWALLP